MKKRNKVVHVNLMGGIIGWILTNPRKALDDKIAENVDNGWNAIYFLPHRDTNLLGIILKLLVLILTLGLFTWGAGYMILFEREVAE